ncbi:MAG TPA: asparagine synthase C-terminal domain-containing protein, partial [Pirellulales bacterium]|nr:asparagine synthase C-terminal domain-containing protein [Pirellulales bacterium]
SAHARTVAARFGTEHTELYTSPAKVFADLDVALASYDQPSIDGLNSYFISQAVRHSGIKVAMSGLGGDELFAGYSTFRRASLLDRQLYRALAKAASPVLTRYSPGTMRADKLAAVLASGGSRLQTYSVFRQVMLSDRRAELMQAAQDDEPPLPAPIVKELTAAIAPLDSPNAYSLLELSLYLANMLLRDTDQMSMAHSLEVRVPILDHRLMETVARVPGSMKLAGLHRASKKRLLIDALPVALPREVFDRKKMGFVFPWELWLRHELRELISCVLNDWEAMEAAGLARQPVQNLWYRYQRYQPGIRYTDILSLVHLLTWVRANKVSL